MTRFTGVLCKQLMLYAQRVQLPSTNREIGSFFLMGGGPDADMSAFGDQRFGGNRKLDMDMDEDSSMVVDISDNDDSKITTEGGITLSKADTGFVEILDVVYDKNGTKHQAVKQQCTLAVAVD